MRIFLVALLLSGCGSACSSTPEPALDPASPADLEAPADPVEPGAAAEPPPARATPPPPPTPPEPIDSGDERVVYASPAERFKVRFSPRDDGLLVANLVSVSDTREQVSLQDLYGRARWQHAYDRVDGVALGDDAAFALADGHLYRYALDSGEPSDLGEATGQLALGESHVYVQEGGVVKRAPRDGGALAKVAEHEHAPGYHRIAVGEGKLLMLASAFRNRPARLPKPTELFAAPAAGGTLKERAGPVFDTGPELWVDAGFAYFGGSQSAENMAYHVLRVPLAGDAKVEAVVKHPLAVFAVEGPRVYAAARLEDSGGGLYAFSVKDEPPQLLSAFEGGASEVLLSEGHVFWESRGRIYRIPKPTDAAPAADAESPAAPEVPSAAAPPQGAEAQPVAGKSGQGAPAKPGKAP